VLDLRLRQLARLEEVKLRAEKEELEGEKADIEKILGSKARMKTLIKKELLADAEEFGDPRRSPLREVEAAQAFSDEDLMTNDPITVVLSDKGWVRSAKGHDMNPRDLNYRSGDTYGAAARGRTNDQLAFMDSTGRAYSVAPHTLPSARGQGEPLTGRLKPPEGARFIGLLMGAKDTKALVSSDAGYGFVVGLEELQSKNKAGKACLSVPKGGTALPPLLLTAPAEDLWLAAATNQGRMLVFPLAEVPELARGKGNKLLNVPSPLYNAGEEKLVDVALLSESQELLVHAGQRHLRLKFKDLDNYIGERARRGRKGFPKSRQVVRRARINPI